MLDGQQGSGIRNARWADPDLYSVKHAYQAGDIWIGRNPHDANYPIGHRDDKHIMVAFTAGSRGRVLEIFPNEDFEDEGAILGLRTEQAFTDQQRRRFEESQFPAIISAIHNVREKRKQDDQQKAEQEKRQKEEEAQRFDQGKDAWKRHLSNSESTKWWAMIITPLGAMWFAGMISGMIAFFLDLGVDFIAGRRTPFVERDTVFDLILFSICAIIILGAGIAMLAMGLSVRNTHDERTKELTEVYGPASKYGL